MDNVERFKKARMPRAFYKEFHETRERYGATEYDKDDLLDELSEVYRRHRGDRDLDREACASLLINVEAKENDPRQDGLFDYGAHVPLGEGRRIKRSKMTLDQHLRRERIIDDNLEAQQQGWRIEKRWLRVGEDALQASPPGTVREDVLNEDGTFKAGEAAD